MGHETGGGGRGASSLPVPNQPRSRREAGGAAPAPSAGARAPKLRGDAARGGCGARRPSPPPLARAESRSAGGSRAGPQPARSRLPRPLCFGRRPVLLGGAAGLLRHRDARGLPGFRAGRLRGRRAALRGALLPSSLPAPEWKDSVRHQQRPPRCLARLPWQPARHPKKEAGDGSGSCGLRPLGGAGASLGNCTQRR